MHTFITALPPETIALIFVNLNQRDQVECMRACRYWYNEIPKHVSETWSTLRIAQDSWPTINVCMTNCLPYTKHIILDGRPTCKILDKLHSAGCQLTTLNVRSHLTPSADFSKLISRVISFGTTLKELTISNMCTSAISEHELLDRCPNLTHLTLLIEYMYMMRVSLLPVKNEYRPTKLVYLHLDNAFICEHRQNTVLGRSPDLKMLVVSIHCSRIVSGTYVPEVNFNSMIDMCPRLQYISWKESEHPQHFTWLPWNKPSKGPVSFSGLSLQGDIDNREQVVPLLKRSQNTLRYLKLCNLRSISSPPISSIRFPVLKDLHLSVISTSPDQWLLFLNACPTLQDLKLELFTDDFNELQAIIQGINSLEHLHKLDLANTSHQMFPDVCHMLSPNPALRELCLVYIPISDEGFINLGDFPSLLNLTIRAKLSSKVSTKGLLEFARKLKDKPLESLTLIQVESLDDMVLYELAQVERLSELIVRSNRRITDNGVIDVITKGKIVVLNGCSFVSRNGVWKRQD